MKPSVSFDVPTLVVGNLIAGGSGKTPHVAYILTKIMGKGRFAILSRGYGRKTKGYLEVHENNTAREVGDEPLQYKMQFAEKVKIAVCEERILAVPELVSTGVEGVVLDDAYQHRKLRASGYVLLTEYSRPFYEDYVIPAGLLREARKGAERADFIIVTKCPDEIPNSDEIKQKIRRYNQHAPIAFSSYEYVGVNMVFGEEKPRVFVFSGIGNPAVFEAYLLKHYEIKGTKRYSDHHHFTKNEILFLKKMAETHNAMLLTTQKDYMRMVNNLEFETILSGVSLGYIPIQVRFVEGSTQFDEYIQKVFNVEK